MTGVTTGGVTTDTTVTTMYNPDPAPNTAKGATRRDSLWRPYPKYTHVEQGKAYYWCSCGSSRTQPFCDGRHKGTDFRPVKWTAPSTGKVLFCMCKTTKNQPLCDMSHVTVLRKMYGGKLATLAFGGAFVGGISYKFIMS